QRRFGDADGKFSFRVQPGRYHVRVRQIGFMPHDTLITVMGDTPPLVVKMTSVPVVLSQVTVRALQHCMKAGVDSTEEPILWGMFSAVRENALREQLLRRSYPFEYMVEVAQTATPAIGRHKQKPALDTLIYRSDAMMPYARGAIVFTDRTDWRGALDRMRLPATIDFADDTFVASHCFEYGNTESGDYSITFHPLEAITAPDVEGTITFDTATYVVRTADVKLTRAKDVAPGFERLEVRTTYREVIPKVALPLVVESTQQYHSAGPDPMLFVATESQTIRSLRFLRGVPDGAVREQTFAPLPRTGALPDPRRPTIAAGATP
ncbi:MAG TPA: carboxypeptidase-like regulatory domain-containing protein, partial [Candidatus Elarobacter sp.]|nr:carboxypeptidase-like regulatory domain-containing protein [Candidatus Elarobacter sp.]